MASTSSKSPAPKPRKRVDAAPPSASHTLKRGSNGSAFIRCDSCNKDIPAATADMHDCMQETKTKAVLAKPVENIVHNDPPPKEKIEAPSKKAQKRKADSEKPKKQKKVVKEKDPNEPKRPPTAFFLFMEEFRKTYKEAHPDSKGVAAVAKEGGEKWKSLSDEEKASYTKKAADLKDEYQSALKAFKASKKDCSVPDDTEEKCDENDDPCDEINDDPAKENSSP